VTTSRRGVKCPDILRADDQLLVIDKPSGVYLTPRPEDRLGAPDMLQGRPDIRPDELFGVVHRLHEQASGAAVYARSAEARRALSRQFDDDQAQAVYWAIVSGYVADDGEIDLLLHYNKGVGRYQISNRYGKSALTQYRVIQRVAGNTLLECRAQRERTDQIRLHLAAIGHPLTVDPACGGGTGVLLSEYKPAYRPSSRRPERPLIDRLTLHCAEISLIHPATNERVVFNSPMPKDMRAVLTQLARL